jgi:hypothetical protein
LKRNKLLYFLFTISLFIGILHSQPVEKIKVKKNPSLIYFFQKGSKNDTLARNKGDLFYLLVPDSLKEDISVQTENAQLVATPDDSIVQLNYVKGFRYELLFQKEEMAQRSRNGLKQYKRITLVNGVSATQANKIIVQIINKKKNGLVLENVFYTK